MPSAPVTSVENNFTKGLITEFTGLNFPENAATDTSNCEYTIIGDVTRRLGINQEANGTVTNVPNINGSNSYMWDNPGGQSNVKILVRQNNARLLFYKIDLATNGAPISTTFLVSQTVNLSNFLVAGASYDLEQECEFAEGNGYLFVYQGCLYPLYLTYNGNIAANAITVKTRDFVGSTDGLPVNLRPNTLTNTHEYNLLNQGWAIGSAWTAVSSTTNTPAIGNLTFNIGTVTGIVAGQAITVTGTASLVGVPAFFATLTGTVVGYANPNITINVTNFTGNTPAPIAMNAWTFQSLNTNQLATWNAANGNWPSNADTWWLFKDASGLFNPGVMTNNVPFAAAQAPQGHYIFDAFNIDRSSISGVGSISVVSTLKRPTTGAWWQGRTWYAGVNDSFNATSSEPYYNWTSNIYFSTIVLSSDDFGTCYQQNDPTAQDFNTLLPTDGGVVTIPEAGIVYKLIPLQNGMLVMASNGMWFITGNQGIGFSATDYTVTHISDVRSFSSRSYVMVNGYPLFWNHEGIYQVEPTKSGGLQVNPITVGTILSFYDQIPLASKKYARGDYDPINYVVQWVYRSTKETGVIDRYNFDSILNYNTYNKAFFPYSISPGPTGQFITGINYVWYPNTTPTTPDPSFKYPYYVPHAGGTNDLGFAQEYDPAYVDWGSVNYTSFFVTGYKVHGKGQRRLQAPYIYIFAQLDPDLPSGYKLQSIWNYATTPLTGRWSTLEIKNMFAGNDLGYLIQMNRHRLRGQGLVMQIRIQSVDGQPFDIQGWSLYENVNQGL